MRQRHHRFAHTVLTVVVVLGLQACGMSKLDWREGKPSPGGGGGSTMIERIRDALQKSASTGDGPQSPEVSILNVHCHPDEFVGRGESSLFLTTSLLGLIDNYTQTELEETPLVIPRELTVIENGEEKIKVKLHYILPLQLYFMVQEVVGPDQMKSEEVKKLFYMFGIPFLPETYVALTGQSRVISLKPEDYAKSWINARRFFEQITQWDLHARLQSEMLPGGELTTWLESRGFFSDEIDFLLKLVWLDEAPPASLELITVYVSIDRCSYTVGAMPWFIPVPRLEEWKEKEPDEIRDHYFKISFFWAIFITKFYCPSPTPSPSPPVQDLVYRPCPSPKYVDQVKIRIGDQVTPSGGGDPHTIRIGDTFTTPGGDTVTIRPGGDVTISIGDTVTTGNGDIITFGAGDQVTPSDGEDPVTFGGGDGTSTSTGGDGTSTTTPTPSSTPTSTPVDGTSSSTIWTYGGCSCSQTLKDFSSHTPPFKVCIQAAPIHKGWDGKGFEDNFSYTGFNAFNGAETLLYDLAYYGPSVFLLKCCEKASPWKNGDRWVYPVNMVGVAARSWQHSYTPTAQYQVCNDGDHVFAFPGGTGEPNGVLHDPGNNVIDNKSASEWYEFVTTNPINRTECP